MVRQRRFASTVPASERCFSLVDSCMRQPTHTSSCYEATSRITCRKPRAEPSLDRSTGYCCLFHRRTVTESFSCPSGWTVVAGAAHDESDGTRDEADGAHNKANGIYVEALRLLAKIITQTNRSTIIATVRYLTKAHLLHFLKVNLVSGARIMH